MPATFDKENYKYKDLIPIYPVVDYPALEEIKVVDKGHLADPEMKSLLSAATRVDNLTPTIGTEIEGIDLRQLSDDQKNDLALLVATRGVVVFRNQPIPIKQLVELAAYYGPPHIHSVGGSVPDPDLKGALIIFNDGTKPLDRLAYDRDNSGWHSDQTFEINTPGLTSLKIFEGPETGGDTSWASGYAIYSSFSPQMQKYLETLHALHSSDQQKQQAIDRGVYIRRPQTDCIHPVVRVHPVTGMKSIFVNGSYTRRIVGIPKAESDHVLRMIYDQIAYQTDTQVRIRWGTSDTVIFWDNRCVWHTPTYDYFYTHHRHGVRSTPHGERAQSVEDYEKETGKKALDWYSERLRSMGLAPEGASQKTAKASGAD